MHLLTYVSYLYWLSVRPANQSRKANSCKVLFDVVLQQIKSGCIMEDINFVPNIFCMQRPKTLLLNGIF